MRSILLSKWDENYLQKCAEAGNIAYGIIIGHQAQPDKFIVVHLAKNREEDIDTEPSDDTDTETSSGVQRLEDIDTQALANQWFGASKMIPGSFTVLGVFVSAVEENILDERTFKAAKPLLYDINSFLQGRSLGGGTADDYINGSYIFLAHSSKAKQTVCKSYTHSANGGSFTTMDCRVVEKPFKWLTIDSNFEFDEVFPIVENGPKINIEKQFQKTINAIRTSLQSSEIFIQNESVEDTLTLETYIKEKNKANLVGDKQAEKINERLWATIYVPMKCLTFFNESRAFKLQKFNDTIRFSGVISSRIFCNPQNTLGDVKRFVREDVIRSIAARIQVYCDGLTAPNIQNDSIFVSEPPRRVYFNLPNCSTATNTNTTTNSTATANNPIQFSDYLFRGEAPTVACSQAKQILDLFIENIIDDMEGLPDVDSFRENTETENVSANNNNNLEKQRTPSKNLYLRGLIFTMVLTILFSIVFKYYFDL